MKYCDIKTPEDLLKYMNENIKYGFVDDEIIYDGKDNQKFQIGCQTKWRLSSPKRLLNVKYGHCFDQVEFERDWFYKNGYNFKTIFIWFEFPYDNKFTTHTYLIYKDDNKWKLFEHSDYSNRGIHIFNNEAEAIKFQTNKHIEQNRKYNPIGDEEIKHLKIYEYKMPRYGCNRNEFINNILDNLIEINIQKWI